MRIAECLPGYANRYTNAIPIRNAHNNTSQIANMSNNVQDPTDSVKSADTPMDTQEHTDKGKGKAIEPEAMSEDDDDEESAEEVSIATGHATNAGNG